MQKPLLSRDIIIYFNCVIYKSFPENHLSDAERRCRIMKKLGKKVAVLEGTLTAFCSCSCSGCACKTSQCTCINNPSATHRTALTNSGSTTLNMQYTGLYMAY